MSLLENLSGGFAPSLNRGVSVPQNLSEIATIYRAPVFFVGDTAPGKPINKGGMPILPQIDGFPLSSDDPDLEIQQRLNDYLAGPADRPSMLATAGRVMKDVSAPEQPRWLMPVLRRCEWLVEHPEHSKPHWAPHLMCAVDLILNHSNFFGTAERPWTNLELLAHARTFRKADDASGPGEFIPRALEEFHKAADKTAWIPALQSAYREFELFERVYGGRHAATLGIALLREGAMPADISCWTSELIRGLARRKKPAAWQAFFRLADTRFEYSIEPGREKVEAAVRKIGPEEFSACLDAWTLPLAHGPAPLTWFGVAVMKVLMHGAAACINPKGDVPGTTPALERIARANWFPAERVSWFIDLLVGAASVLPNAKQILEPLALRNPSKASLLAALVEPAQSDQPLGVDGYPFDEKPAHAMFQRRIDEWFRLPGNPFANKGPDLRTLAAGPGGKPDFPGLLTAILDRTHWLTRHDKLVEQAFDKRLMLGQRIRELASEVGDPGDELLHRLLESEAAGMLYCPPNDWLLPWVEKRLDPAGFLSEALAVRGQAWHDSCHGTTSGMAFRQKLGWLLWHADPRPMKASRCWSSRIREDIRPLAPWRTLLRHTTFAMADQPPAKLLKETAPLLAAIGPQEFARRFHAWMKPFSEPAPIVLEVPGRDLLRNLFWHAAGIHDPRIDEALAWFPPVKWKNKKVEGYTSKLIGPYVYAAAKRAPEAAHPLLQRLVDRNLIVAASKNFKVYEELCAKLQRPLGEGRPAPAPPTQKDFVTQSLAGLSHCDVTPDTVRVRGSLETYLIDRATRLIRRERDLAVLEFDANAGVEAEYIADMMQRFAKSEAAIIALVQLLHNDAQIGQALKPVTRH